MLVGAVNQTADKPYYLFDGYAHLAAGLSCGLAGLAAGMAIGIVGDAGVRQASTSCCLCLAAVVQIFAAGFKFSHIQMTPCRFLQRSQPVADSNRVEKKL